MQKVGNTYILSEEEYNKKELSFTGLYSYMIRIDNETYYYKKISKEEAINELLCERLGNIVGLNMNHYELVLYDNNYSVMSKNFKKNNANYIEGYRIIIDYAKKHEQFKGDFSVKEANNLENIWNAVEYRYREYANRDIIVKNIMKEISQLFMFDIITGQIDRHSSNYMIEERKDTISLAPIYDNHFAFSNNEYGGIKVHEGKEVTESINYLKEFINESSYEFREELERMVLLLNPSVFIRTIKDIEREYNIKVNHYDYLVSTYEKKYNQLYSLLFKKLDAERT